MGKVHQQIQDDNFSASPFVCVSKHLHDYIYNIYPVVRKTVIMARNKLAEKIQASKQEKIWTGQSTWSITCHCHRRWWTTNNRRYIHFFDIQIYNTNICGQKKTRNSWWTWTKDTFQKKNTRALRNQNKNKEKSKDNYEIEKRKENVKTADEICNGNWIISMCVCVERLNFLGQR